MTFLFKSDFIFLFSLRFLVPPLRLSAVKLFLPQRFLWFDQTFAKYTQRAARAIDYSRTSILLFEEIDFFDCTLTLIDAECLYFAWTEIACPFAFGKFQIKCS